MARLSSEAPAGARVDPRKTDAGAHKPPEQTLRDRRQPHPAEAAAKAKLEARVQARPAHAAVIIEPAGSDREEFTSVHEDERLHDLQLCEAFGTRSYAVIATFMTHLQDLCSDQWWDKEANCWRLNEATYNTLLALISSLKPRNEMEAALAAQMAAVHLMTMKVSARAIRYDYDNRTAATAGKLARTFAMQMDTWRAMRGKSRTTKQSIKVTKETHYHVHQHGTRGVDENVRQSQGRRGVGGAIGPETADERNALPGADQSGRVVPLPSRARA